MSRQTDFAQRVYRAGLDAGLPDHLARLAATQASLETGYGKSVKGNNFFGIKAGQSWTGKKQNLTTHEEYNGKRVKIKDSFRAYDDPADSLRDWAHLLKNKFPDAYNSRNFDEAVAGLQTGVYGAYATDSKYGSKLHSINNKYVGNPQPIRVAELDGLPPQRPSALSAINDFAPIEAEKPPTLAYQGPTPPIRPSTLPSAQPAQPDIGKAIANNLSLADKWKLRHAPKTLEATQKGVTKVASAIGDVGRYHFENAKDRFDGLTAPTPPVRPNTTFDPMQVDVAQSLQTTGAAGGPIPETHPNIPTRPEVITSPFDFNALPPPPAGLQEAVDIKAASIVPPTPIARPQGLDGPQNPLLGLRNAVQASMPALFNMRHDVLGQIDGVKISAQNQMQNTLARALGNRPSTPTSSLPSGYQRGSNDYLYGKNSNTGRFKQVGKSGPGGDRIYNDVDLNRKPKRVYDAANHRWELR